MVSPPVDKKAPSVRPFPRDPAPPGAVGKHGASSTKKGSRNEYFRERRRELSEKAKIAVAKAWGHDVSCFQCAKKAGVLELDHLFYAPNSIRFGHGEQRAAEAIAFPKRFVLHCRACHIDLDLKKMQHTNAAPEVGSETRAIIAHVARENKKRVRLGDPELRRKEGVIMALRERNYTLNAECDYLSSQLDMALSLCEELNDEVEGLRART